LDHQHVEFTGVDGRQHRIGARRSNAGAGHHAGVANLTDTLRHQLGLDRFGVDVLHSQRRLVVGQRGDFDQQWLRVVVARPDALEIQHCDTAKAADLNRRCGRHHPVHGTGHERKLESEGIDLPGDVDVFGIAGAARRYDRDVVEAVGPPPRLSQSDLDFSHRQTPRET
jgi:hypothetical protein